MYLRGRGRCSRPRKGFRRSPRSRQRNNQIDASFAHLNQTGCQRSWRNNHLRRCIMSHRSFRSASLLLLALAIGFIVSNPPVLAKETHKIKARTATLVAKPGKSRRVIVDIREPDGQISKLEFVLTNIARAQPSDIAQQQRISPMTSGSSGCYGTITRTVYNGLAWKWEATQYFNYNTSPASVTLTSHTERATTANGWSYHHRTYSSAYLPGPIAHVVDNGYFTNP